MTQIPFEFAAGPTPRLPGLRAWLQGRIAAATARRSLDAPVRRSEAELRDLYYRNRDRQPVATDAMTQNALRAGLWGRL